MQKGHRDIDGDAPPRKTISASKVVADASESKSSGDLGDDFDDDFIRRQAEMLRHYEHCKLPPKTVSKDGNDTHGGHLINQDLIEEQRRIYEEIQGQRNKSWLKSDSRRKPAIFGKKTTVSKSSSVQPGTDSATGARTRTVRNDTYLSSQSEAKTTSDAKRVVEDQVILYDNEKKLHIKGTHHVIHSISNGRAVIVQCPSCQAVLQVDKSCSTLYCVCCHQVSPMEGDSATMDDIATESMPDALAEHIVRSVQRQEIDVAAARRAAKLARSDVQDNR